MANEFNNKKGINKKSLRNLPQFRNLSDKDFDETMDKRDSSLQSSKAFEEIIAKKMKEFEEDYDLSDMKVNDRDTLRALIQNQISLESYEQKMFTLRSVDITDAIMYKMEKISKIMEGLRGDISKQQNDLNITRKVRKSDQDVSVLAYITGLKEKAKKFYESKMSYVFCPKCNMLLGTFWTLYPAEERNRIQLVCNRIMDDGSKCGEKIVVGTKELLANRGTSNKAITPESML